MTDNVTKTSALPQSNTVAGTDRLVFVANTTGAPSTRTVSLTNLANSIFSTIAGPYANDAVANTNGVAINTLYYDSTGTVKIRLV